MTWNSSARKKTVKQISNLFRVIEATEPVFILMIIKIEKGRFNNIVILMDPDYKMLGCPIVLSRKKIPIVFCKFNF